jgi:hypothetical protein
MELCAVALLAGAGYLVSRARTGAAPLVETDDDRRIRMLEQAAYRTVGAAEGDRPSQTSVYESRHLDDVRADEGRRAGDLARRALDPAHPGISSPIHSRPQGVHSQLLGREVPIESFTHNNMVPFYGSKIRQQSVSMDPGGRDVVADKLEAFTGAASLRPSKSAEGVAPLFRPAGQGFLNSAGRSVASESREAWLAAMQPSRNRNNEAPIAPVVVGRPGVAGGESGDVYFDMRAAASARTVDELRAGSNPKLTFEGRMLPGQAIAGPAGARAALPTVRERTFAPLVRELTSADQLIRTVGATGSAEALRPDDLRDVKATQRQTTTAPYVGAAGGGAFTGPDAREVSAPFRTWRANLAAPPVGAASATKTKNGDYGRSSVLVYGNNRDVTTVEAPKANLVSAFKALVAPIQDALRTTKKETDGVDAPRAFGNAGAHQGVPRLTVYDASDVARTTLKQITAATEAPLTNLSGGAVPRLALQHDDVARTARGETTLAEAPLTNLRGGAARLTVYDPSDVARTARKETTLQSSPLGNARGDPRAAEFDPDAWRVPTTHRDVVAGSGRAGPQDGNVGMSGGPGAYAGSATYVASTTQRQIDADDSSTAYGAAAGLLRSGGYRVAPDDVKTTQKEALSDRDYFGAGVGSVEGNMSHADAEAMRVDSSGQELLLSGRDPTQSSVKLAANLAAIGAVVAHGSGGLGETDRPLDPRPAAVLLAGREGLGMTMAPRGDLPEYLGASADRTSLMAEAAAFQRASNPVATSIALL